MTNRHELETETQPVVITTLGRYQVPVRIIEEEEPLKDRLLGCASEPAIHRFLGSSKKSTHDRSD